MMTAMTTITLKSTGNAGDYEILTEQKRHGRPWVGRGTST